MHFCMDEVRMIGYILLAIVGARGCIKYIIKDKLHRVCGVKRGYIYIYRAAVRAYNFEPR